ncbi:MAG: hypothetical protein QCI82_06305 [Candidatus Thermoplasmatota archaeon]|nr:hypothetical protein [Candidatus Thermoplasmatota archaeon]
MGVPLSDQGGYLALFDGLITGEVRNPYTGKVYQRMEVMDFYRSLLYRACRKPIDERTIDMLEMVRSFLDIPSDIHLCLLIEVRDSSVAEREVGPGQGIVKDMDEAFDRWMAAHLAHQKTVMDLFDEFRKGSMTEETTLIDSGERSLLDSQIGESLIEIMDREGSMSGFDSLFESRRSDLSSFQRRYVRP